MGHETNCWDKIGPNCPFAWKVYFLGKLTNTTIVYLLGCMFPNVYNRLQNIVRVGRITRYKVSHFSAKLPTNHPFTLKGFLLKNWLTLILSTSCKPSQYLQCLKKTNKLDHKIKGCIIFGQISDVLYLFFGWGKEWLVREGELTKDTFPNLLCPIILKNLKNPKKIRTEYQRRKGYIIVLQIVNYRRVFSTGTRKKKEYSINQKLAYSLSHHLTLGKNPPISIPLADFTHPRILSKKMVSPIPLHTNVHVLTQ